MKTIYLQLISYSIFFLAGTLLGQQPSLLSVNGKYLVDECGETIILKGLNHGNIYDVSDFGVGEMAEIEKTGANAVRIVVEREYCTFPPPNYTCVKVPTTAAQITTMLQATLNHKMIPILELHDFTGSANPTNDLVTAANWWTTPEILNVLKAHQNYLILNIANEPSSSNYPPSSGEQTTYYNANVSAINILRNAGLTCPIMIDGMHWGKDHTFFVNHGNNLMNADPLHKLLFSVHTYWPSSGNAILVTDAQMTSYMNALGNLNAPVVLGEIAHDEVQGGGIYPINYTLLMNLAQTHDIGYLIWWWGRIEGGESPLYITTNGLYTGLTAHGNVMVNSHPNSIANTSVRPYRLVHGECDSMGVSDVETKKDIQVYPNPFTNQLEIESKYPVLNVEIFNSAGNKIMTTNSTTIHTTHLPSGIYFLKIETNLGFEMIKTLKK